MKVARPIHATTPHASAAPERSRKRRPRRLIADWPEALSSREHIPLPQRMAESIEISSRLSKLPMIGREQLGEVNRMVPEEVVPLLEAAGIDFVLVGAHGLSGWLAEPRATQDVDFVIKIRDKRKACDSIVEKFPEMELEKHPDVWRLKKGDEYLIDLILTRSPLFKRVIREFEYSHVGKNTNRRKVKVPKLEAALVMKFASMIGHFRKLRKKYIDAGDFMSIVETNPRINRTLLREMGELVYPGGGDEIVKMVEDVKAGRKLEI